MSFNTLPVHAEADPTQDPRLALAIDLANQFDAKLIGIGAEHYRTAYYGGFGDASAGYLIAAEMESVEADLKRAEEKFRAAALAVREGSDWRATVQFPLFELAAEARAADLVIASRSARRGASDYNIAHSGALTLHTGRPVLVTPPRRSAADRGERGGGGGVEGYSRRAARRHRRPPLPATGRDDPVGGDLQKQGDCALARPSMCANLLLKQADDAIGLP